MKLWQRQSNKSQRRNNDTQSEESGEETIRQVAQHY
jgi:hypothetical protein